MSNDTTEDIHDRLDRLETELQALREDAEAEEIPDGHRILADKDYGNLRVTLTAFGANDNPIEVWENGEKVGEAYMNHISNAARRGGGPFSAVNNE